MGSCVIILASETGATGLSSPLGLPGLWIVPVIFPEVTLYGLLVEQGLILEIGGLCQAPWRDLHFYVLTRWVECRGHIQAISYDISQNERPTTQTSIDNEIMTRSTLAQEILYGNLRGV